MRLVLIGPPLCGKSVQARMLSEKFSLPHISPGDLFREEMAKSSKIGLRVQELVNSGKLVPDEIVIDIVKDFLETPACKNGFVMDGFPRTIEQARFLIECLESKGTRLDRMIVLKVHNEEIFRRATGRRKKEDRKDDESDKTLTNRITAYRNQALPAIKYFETLGLVSHVDGTLTIPRVSEKILRLLAQSANEKELTESTVHAHKSKPSEPRSSPD